MQGALTWRRLLPSLQLGLFALALFAAGLWIAREFDELIREVIVAHQTLGVLFFVATSVIAVLLPLLSNLPLLPLAVAAWGPEQAAVLLLLGWLGGAVLSFALGRYAQAPVLRYLPSVQRHADIDRLIDPRRRLMTLVLLRMTFPVDVLSYALGLFSRTTTWTEVALSTAIGAAPFAVLFAWFPVMPAAVQLLVLGVSAIVFVAYARWVVRRERA